MRVPGPTLHTPSEAPPKPPPCAGPSLSTSHLPAPCWALVPLHALRHRGPDPSGRPLTPGRVPEHLAPSVSLSPRPSPHLCCAREETGSLRRCRPAVPPAQAFLLGPLTRLSSFPHRAAAATTRSCGTRPSMRSAWIPSPPSASGCEGPPCSPGLSLPSAPPPPWSLHLGPASPCTPTLHPNAPDHQGPPPPAPRWSRGGWAQSARSTCRWLREGV